MLASTTGAPKPPRNLTAVWTDDSSVRLSWIPGFHGGKPQTFVVQYQDITKKDSFNQIWKSVPTKFQVTWWWLTGMSDQLLVRSTK